MANDFWIFTKVAKLGKSGPLPLSFLPLSFYLNQSTQPSIYLSIYLSIHLSIAASNRQSSAKLQKLGASNSGNKSFMSQSRLQQNFQIWFPVWKRCREWIKITKKQKLNYNNHHLRVKSLTPFFMCGQSCKLCRIESLSYCRYPKT